MSAVSSSATHFSPGGSSQRQHILDTALALMSQRGVDGTSMRDLASAAGLNVASLYHYFPSKRDLLVAVLEERGFVADLTTPRPTAVIRGNDASALAGLLDDMLQSMLEVEEFVRLMLGEVMRGDETAHSVGVELFTATQASIETWLTENEPAMCEAAGADAIARVIRGMIVGVFFEYVAGVLDDGGDTSATFRRRADEAASVLKSLAARDGAPEPGTTD